MARRTPSVRFESPSTSPLPFAGIWRRWLDCFRHVTNGSTENRGSSSGPSRRILGGEDEEQNFQFEKTHCLSSYYSVFVARLAIMVMLAILIGMLTILTWHFTRSYTTKSINSLAYGLRYELLQRPILRMWNILNSTVEITMAQVKLCEYVIDRYGKPMAHTRQLELYEVMRDVTWALFASRKALNAITISHRNGFVQAFHRDHRNNSTYYIYSDLPNSSHIGGNYSFLERNASSIWYREPLNPATGATMGIPRQIPPEDLITIAGLSEVHDGAASWHVAVSKYTDSPLLSAALPVFDPIDNKSITAVVGVTTALFSVGQLMRELVEIHSGHMYLTSKEGYLLATSTESPLLRNSSSGPSLMMATDSKDDIIRSGAEWLQNTYGNKFSINHEIHVENVMLGSQRCYIDSFFVDLKRLPLVGVIIIPRNYIMGKIDERAITTLIILITASLCILAIGCVCIFFLTSGVSKEMKLRAELISHLDARRRAEASSNYKSQFLANMSHELRTPMAAVIGLLDILMCDDCLSNEQFATVTQIRKCSTALLRLLNNILDLSKVESGKLVLEDAEFDLGRELEGLMDMFSVQCINHNVETVLDLADDMPKLVRGDSARVVQIFANLISNSIKFTSSGHVILRGWCENSRETLYLDQKNTKPAVKTKSRHHRSLSKRSINKDNTITLRFEVDDTGSGIDPSKWETVFESFEQADPSTTRTHGGTGLGLCIVRTLVNKMGGEVKVVKKDGPGTLMRLHLVLSARVDGMGHYCQIQFVDRSLMVLLALNGKTSRCIMSNWLRKSRICTREASEWNELAQILQEAIQGNRIDESAFTTEHANNEHPRLNKMRALNGQNLKTSTIVILVDIGLLNMSTNIWKDQLNFLERYHGKASFAWILNHDTPGVIKTELRRKGHLLMVNKPLYKSKIVQILEAILRERNFDLQRQNNVSGTLGTEDLCECLETDQIHFDVTSTDDSDISDIGGCKLGKGAILTEEENGERILPPSSPYFSTSSPNISESEVKSSEVSCCSDGPEVEGKDTGTHLGKSCFKTYVTDGEVIKAEHPSQTRSVTSQVVPNQYFQSLPSEDTTSTQRMSEFTGRTLQVTSCQPIKDCSDKNSFTGSPKASAHQGSLQGLCILLAEDTPVLQRVATIMLEKMGATVMAVGDGLQAVEALRCTLNRVTLSPTEPHEIPQIDLILMDCQMPKMDGYEATKEIRRSEEGTSSHIPIVALTAHAMYSDEAKCLAVGMDAYLAKPIDYKLMVSTILSLTKRAN
ncbi:histidine kinase 1-like [Aristolochia californica]|uniref:histidine kinase 1-like n=1 Tax=Aristolochia californica TaxID=171875 RepID=UPI0035E207AF